LGGGASHRWLEQRDAHREETLLRSLRQGEVCMAFVAGLEVEDAAQARRGNVVERAVGSPRSAFDERIEPAVEVSNAADGSGSRLGPSAML